MLQNGTVEVQTPPLCNIYTPLNSSEYQMMENGSLYLEKRKILLSPDQYLSFGDGYAVCLDGLTTPPSKLSVVKGKGTGQRVQAHIV